jgi:hypothetical protein
MSTNLQSRSASISVEESSTPPVPGKLMKASANLGAKTGLRSASIGSNFFHKDSSNFFTPAANGEVSNTSVTTTDVEKSGGTGTDSVVADLDIVGALGNLDLDGDFSLPQDIDEQSESNSLSQETSTSSTPFSQQYQFLYGENNFQGQFYPQYPHHHQGSLTPNPSVGGFMPSAFGQVNIPSSTWNNNFIPSSAPPFTYGNSEPNDLSLVKPFELPDDSETESKPNNLHPMSPPTHSFGGILDPQVPFGIPPPEIYAPYAKGDSGPSESEMESSRLVKGAGSGEYSAMANQDAKIAHPMPHAHPSHLSFTPPPHGGIAVNAGQGPPHEMNQFHGLEDGMAMQMQNMMPQLGGPNMWNQHAMMTSQMHNMRNNVDNRPLPHMQPHHGQLHRHHMSVGPNQYNQGMNGNDGNHRYNNRERDNSRDNGNSGSQGRNRNNFGMNDGMNVHRKMHNSHSRRKGEDASKYANSKLEDFTGEIYSLCKDQHGCRFLQRQLDLGREAAEGKASDSTVLTNDIAATMIFNEIYLKIIELMTDPFGNYLIQKLFENVSTDQRIILVKNASPDFIRIALDPHGTRALQKLVECISTEDESKLIIDSLSPHIVSLSRDLNGNHVVQKCLQKLKPQENQFIFDAASYSCIEIATHRHGCCVLQRCLDHGSFEQRKQLSMKVAENATSLSLDPFGNYVVQYVLSRGDNESIQMILDHIRSNVISLSLHKFGSNVIEKSLRINKLTDSLIEVLLKNEEKFSEMLNDAFGNYVLQTSLDVANSRDISRLSQALQPLLPNIKNTPHGRRIMTKIQSIM